MSSFVRRFRAVVPRARTSGVASFVRRVRDGPINSRRIFTPKSVRAQKKMLTWFFLPVFKTVYPSRISSTRGGYFHKTNARNVTVEKIQTVRQCATSDERRSTSEENDGKPSWRESCNHRQASHPSHPWLNVVRVVVVVINVDG